MKGNNIHMFFNKWQKISKKKPPKDGWYTCIVKFEDQIRVVIDLYWKKKDQSFTEQSRQFIFDAYDVYDIFHNKLYTCQTLCEYSKNVIAWKKVSKPFKGKINV